MVDFLRKVDSPPVEQLVQKLAEMLVKIEVFEPRGLFGLNADLIKRDLQELPEPIHMSAGAFGLVARAIYQIATENQMQVQLPAQAVTSQQVCTLADLKDALGSKKEETKVHIDVCKRLRETTVEDLCQNVQPPGKLVDELASEVARLRKWAIDGPFVMDDPQKM